MSSAKSIKKILRDLRAGKISPGKAYEQLRELPYSDLDFARIDHHRSIRKGFGEVIYGPGKTPEQLKAIIEKIVDKEGDVLITRCAKDKFLKLRKNFPFLKFNEQARIVYAKKRKPTGKKTVLILTAGTGDIPVAEEAGVTLEVMGNSVKRVYDVGVAGIHRLFDNMNHISKANVIIVVAGMEGALASVVSGLTDKPVIAVPTGVGYGAGFRGIAPLLTMMNCCSPGVAVVNIDNGFGAGYFASLINR